MPSYQAVRRTVYLNFCSGCMLKGSRLMSLALIGLESPGPWPWGLRRWAYDFCLDYVTEKYCGYIIYVWQKITEIDFLLSPNCSAPLLVFFGHTLYHNHDCIGLHWGGNQSRLFWPKKVAAKSQLITTLILSVSHGGGVRPAYRPPLQHHRLGLYTVSFLHEFNKSILTVTVWMRKK